LSRGGIICSWLGFELFFQSKDALSLILKDLVTVLSGIFDLALKPVS
jgi:hypothetical protein